MNKTKTACAARQNRMRRQALMQLRRASLFVQNGSESKQAAKPWQCHIDERTDHEKQHRFQKRACQKAVGGQTALDQPFECEKKRDGPKPMNGPMQVTPPVISFTGKFLWLVSNSMCFIFDW